MYPAAYNFVLGVEASSNTNGTLASFSNFDEDGPITSIFANLENYELRAPGTSILSTFPNGQYKQLNGTSMACPLVAGALSRLISVKDINSKEELFGDLIASTKGNLNIYNAYNISDTDRKPSLSLVTYRLDDAKMGDGDGRPDAGETIRFYPTLRNNWGYAKNITYSLEVAENEDPDIIEFVDGSVKAVSNLSSYASVEGETPVLIKINPNCADGRIISLVFKATCENILTTLEQKVEFKVENGVELGGVLREDVTLTSNQHYIVTSILTVPQNITLTILPGTHIEFRAGTGLTVDDGQSKNSTIYVDGTAQNETTYPNAGKIIAKGSADNRIIFSAEESGYNPPRIEYWGYESQIEYLSISGILTTFYKMPKMSIQKCIFENNRFYFPTTLITNSNIINNIVCHSSDVMDGVENNNFVRNSDGDGLHYLFGPEYSEGILSNNFFNNFFYPNYKDKYIFSVRGNSKQEVTYNLTPSYFGSNNEKILRNTIWDILHPLNITYGSKSTSEIDLSNRLTRPNPLAPGIVWKVGVNDYDTQDEFELLPPLGVGKHKFEVYFSKPMNHEKTPMIAMGVREPYTQIAIAEDGSWRSETMENGDIIDIYTAYLTIKGKDNFDGLNTIYVADAEDEEFFPIPIEDVRFHVNVQSAGSMSTGFVAEPGVGKVTLTWDNPEENFDDMLGYNLYRYTLNENDEPNEAVRINETLLDTEEFVDYDIVPGTTYCYYYKVLRTSMDENAPSRVVSATPRAAGKGDANGSGNVDVSDVVTEVNYMVGRDPKPFIFDAADVNDDTEVDILDVVGTVNIIMAPQSQSNIASVQSSATYFVENGILYVDSPVELAGVQVSLSAARSKNEISVLEGLKGMESTGDWLSENEYKFLSFSLSGKTIAQGKTALLSIGDAEINSITLVDVNAKEVMAIEGNTTGISSIVMHQMSLPTPNPFTDYINVPVVIGKEGMHSVELSLVNLAGVQVYSTLKSLDFGKHSVVMTPGNIPSGFYMLSLTVDGNLVQSIKVIKK